MGLVNSCVPIDKLEAEVAALEQEVQDQKRAEERKQTEIEAKLARLAQIEATYEKQQQELMD